jgi:hypothetical protein
MRCFKTRNKSGLKVFVGSKIWYLKEFHLFQFPKYLGCYKELFRKEHSLINSDETKEKEKKDFDDEEDKEEFWPHW